MLEEDWIEIFAEIYEQDVIPVMPRQKVIYPYEWWHEEITDPEQLKILLKAYENGKYIGMIYSPEGDDLLPPVGSVGTAAAFAMQKVNDSRYLVQFRGLPRFTSLKYLDEATIYPMTEVEFFEDFAEDPAVLRSELIKTIELMEETERIRGFKSKRGNVRALLKGETGAFCISFFLMKFWAGLHETRHEMIRMRSTLERLRHAQGLVAEYNKNEAVAERLSHQSSNN
jgi:hypothetical protein